MDQRKRARRSGPLPAAPAPASASATRCATPAWPSSPACPAQEQRAVCVWCARAVYADTSAPAGPTSRSTPTLAGPLLTHSRLQRSAAAPLRMAAAAAARRRPQAAARLTLLTRRGQTSPAAAPAMQTPAQAAGSGSLRCKAPHRVSLSDFGGKGSEIIQAAVRQQQEARFAIMLTDRHVDAPVQRACFNGSPYLTAAAAIRTR